MTISHDILCNGSGGRGSKPTTQRYELEISVVACQRYICPNVISMTMNVIIQ